jgi:hypothetical protein
MFYPNRIKIVIIYKNFFNNHDFLYFFKSLINRKEPKPQFVISAPTPAVGGNLISAPRLKLPNKDIEATYRY